MKNFNWLIYFGGILLLNIHSVFTHLEFFFPIQNYLPVYDLILLLLSWQILKTTNGKREILPYILNLIPATILIFILKDKILSEYFFYIILIKTVLIFHVLELFRKKKFASDATHNKYAFCFFLTLLIIPNLFYTLTDFTPFSWDPSRHSRNIFHLFNLLFERHEGLFSAYMHYDLYPSLGYILTLPFIIIFGKSNDALVLSIIFFWLPLSYYFIKKIVNEIFRVREDYSIIISFIYHSNIIFLAYYKQFLLDFQPIALLTVYYYYVWKSCFFNNKKFSIVSGLILGCGFLIKQSFFLYVFPVILLISGKQIRRIILSFKKNNSLRFNYFINLFLHLIIALTVILPWFGGWHFMYSYEMSMQPAIARMEGDPEPISIDSLLWYFPWFVYSYTWPILLILVFGWYQFFKEKKLYIHKYIATTSIAIIFTVLTYNINKDIRYISGIFYFIGFGFCGLYYLNQKFRNALIISALSLCILNSINLITWEKLPILFLAKDNYVMPASPNHPSFHNEGQSLAAFEKIFLKQPFKEDQKIISYQFLKDDIYFNSYTKDLYRNQLNIEPPIVYDSLLHSNIQLNTEYYRSEYSIVNGKSPYDNAHYLFGRNSLYPTYYLLEFVNKDSSALIQICGIEGNLTADLLLNVQQFKGDSLIQTNEIWLTNQKVKFSINKNCSELHIKIKLHHHRGRWQLIYLNKFTPYFKNDYFSADFTAYSKNINKAGEWVIKLN